MIIQKIGITNFAPKTYSSHKTSNQGLKQTTLNSNPVNFKGSFVLKPVSSKHLISKSSEIFKEIKAVQKTFAKLLEQSRNSDTTELLINNNIRLISSQTPNSDIQTFLYNQERKLTAYYVSDAKKKTLKYNMGFLPNGHYFYSEYKASAAKNEPTGIIYFDKRGRVLYPEKS